MSPKKRAPLPPIVSVVETWSGWIAMLGGRPVAQGATRADAEADAVARGYRTRTLYQPRIASLVPVKGGWIADFEGKTVARGATKEKAEAAANALGYLTRPVAKRAAKG
jgi:hypothetical protein